MKVIALKTKTNAVLCTLLALLMILMGVLSWQAGGIRVESALLITPAQPVSAPVDLKELENRNGSDYLLTYEMKQAGKVYVLNQNIDAVVKGTNYLYTDVMRMPSVSGSFFSKAAQEEGRKLAVLNEKAAFEMLGDMNAIRSEIQIDGDIFTVCGVISDGDEKNHNIYVPLREEWGFSAPDSFAAVIDPDVETAKEDVMNHLKGLAVSDQSYGFYRLNDYVHAILTKTLFSLKYTAAVCLFFCLLSGLAWVRRKIRRVQALHERYDPADIWRNGRHEVVCVFVGAGALAAAVILMMALFLSGAEDILSIHNPDLSIASLLSGAEDMTSLMNAGITIDSVYSSGFSQLIGSVNQLSFHTHVAFLGYLVVINLFFIANILK
jgi:hypothetical protein